ncbi:MAG: MFS transporter [Dehalococcoidia bacterium]|nr:MFS transporter [Dehalococcoidia bacterium]
MISVALPDVLDDLDAPLRWVGWVITIFTLMQAVSMPIAGKLSDELGRRNVFAVGMGLFVASSLICAVSPNVAVLIAARALQGISAGALITSAYGIVGEAFGDGRAQAVGLLSSIFAMGQVAGPNFGGLVVDSFGWRYTFLLNVPLGLAVVAGAVILMRPGVRPKSGSIDLAGAGLLAAAVTAGIFALTEMAQTTVRPNMLLIAGSFVAAGVLGYLFIRREGRIAEPIIDLQLLKQRDFLYVNVLDFFYGVAFLGFVAFVPLYAATAYNMGPTETGLLMTPRALLVLAASALTSLFLARTGYRKPLAIGFVLLTITLVVLSFGIHPDDLDRLGISGFLFLAAVVGVSGAALGVSNPATINMAIELAPERIAAITGLRGMFRLCGAALGTAVIVLVASRAPTTAQGLEYSFMGLAVVTVLLLPLVRLVPDGRGGPGKSGSGSRTQED